MSVGLRLYGTYPYALHIQKYTDRLGTVLHRKEIHNAVSSLLYSVFLWLVCRDESGIMKTMKCVYIPAF